MRSYVGTVTLQSVLEIFIVCNGIYMLVYFYTAESRD